MSRCPCGERQESPRHSPHEQHPESKIQLTHELHGSTLYRDRGDLSSMPRTDVRVRCAEAGVIDYVGRFATEFHNCLAPDVERLAQGEVDVGKSRTIDTIPARIAEGAGRGRREGSSVEPLVDVVRSSAERVT